MFDKRWIVLPEHIYGKDSTVDQIKAELMRVRGIAPGDEEAFFAPPVLPPVPEDSALEAAVDIILTAVDDGLRISIFGDYDCDGICATAILYHFLKNCAGADVDYCIPDRFGEGYGITPAASRQKASMAVLSCPPGNTAYLPMDRCASRPPSPAPPPGQCFIMALTL